MANDKSLEAQVAETHAIVAELRLRLLGNGQKGVIQVHDEQIDKIMAVKNKFTGALSVISFFVAALGFTKVAEMLGWL